MGWEIKNKMTTNKFLNAVLASISGVGMLCLASAGLGLTINSSKAREALEFERGYKAAQVEFVIESDYNFDGTNDLRLVQNDGKFRAFVPNPSPQEYGMIGETTAGIEGTYVSVDAAKNWELGQLERTTLKAKHEADKRFFENLSIIGNEEKAAKTAIDDKYDGLQPKERRH
jgi:hypothetical protein